MKLKNWLTENSNPSVNLKRNKYWWVKKIQATLNNFETVCPPWVIQFIKNPVKENLSSIPGKKKYYIFLRFITYRSAPCLQFHTFYLNTIYYLLLIIKSHTTLQQPLLHYTIWITIYYLLHYAFQMYWMKRKRNLWWSKD